MLAVFFESDVGIHGGEIRKKCEKFLERYKRIDTVYVQDEDELVFSLLERVACADILISVKRQQSYPLLLESLFKYRIYNTTELITYNYCKIHRIINIFHRSELWHQIVSVLFCILYSFRRSALVL